MSRKDDGAIAILVAVFAVVIFGFAALVVDLGMLRVTKAGSRAAADAAALAGADTLFDPPNPTPNFARAVDAVKASAAGNGTPQGDWNSCTAPLPGSRWRQNGSGTNCILFDSATRPRRVQVVLPSRRVDAAFGGVLGYSGQDISALAQAQARDRQMQDCSLCVAGQLDVRNDVTVDGDGSVIAGSGRVHAGGLIRLTPAAVDSGAGIGFATWPPDPAPPSSRYSPRPEQAAPDQPFAGTVEPSRPGNNAASADFECDDGETLQTGFAYRNVTIEGSCSVSNGTVFVTGNFDVEDDAVLTGTNATLFFTCRQGNQAQSCSTGNSRSSLDVKRDGLLRLTGGSLAFGSRTLSILVDVSNTSTMEVDGALVVNNGSIYQRSGRLTVGGSVNVSDLVSVNNLAVGTAATVDVRATDLDGRAGAYRLALVR